MLTPPGVQHPRQQQAHTRLAIAGGLGVVQARMAHQHMVFPKFGDEEPEPVWPGGGHRTGIATPMSNKGWLERRAREY
jgi:hypothetical protein